MKNIMHKKSALALAVLTLSLGQTVHAAPTQNETDNTGTYWGVGIGSVIGAVMAGPPGAALGATLGGSIGWGQAKDQALDQSLVDLEKNELALGETLAELNHNKSKLKMTKKVVSDLSRANAQQSEQLENLAIQKSGAEQSNSVLKAVIGHYAQEVYFKNGQSTVPTYVQERLNRLTEFLKSQPNLQVVLKGYTDQRGPTEFNKALAQARVEGIKEALVAQGVEANRVMTQAIGESGDLLTQSPSEPLVGANQPDVSDYVLDRRVSIELSVSDQVMQPIASIEESSL